jgi:pimeloyl-ACP methyl ester carboxylesterase
VPAAIETRFATSADGDHVAYQVVGDGPIDVLVNRPTLFPVDLMWDEPHVVHFLNRLSSFCRHMWFDPRGTGASDGIAHGDVRLLESIVDDMVTVLNAVDVRRAVLLGLSIPAGLLFAATHPERTHALVLVNAFARFRKAEDYPEGFPRKRSRPSYRGTRACPKSSLQASLTTPGFDDGLSVRPD